MFPKSLHHFILLPAIYDNFGCFISLAIFGVARLFFFPQAILAYRGSSDVLCVLIFLITKMSYSCYIILHYINYSLYYITSHYIIVYYRVYDLTKRMSLLKRKHTYFSYSIRWHKITDFGFFFSCAYWSFESLSLWNVCTSLVSIFVYGCLFFIIELQKRIDRW